MEKQLSTKILCNRFISIELLRFLANKELSYEGKIKSSCNKENYCDGECEEGANTFKLIIDSQHHQRCNSCNSKNFSTLTLQL